MDFDVYTSRMTHPDVVTKSSNATYVVIITLDSQEWSIIFEFTLKTSLLHVNSVEKDSVKFQTKISMNGRNSVSKISEVL